MSINNRWNNTKYYGCSCGDPSHYLYLWIDQEEDKDVDWDVDISFGWHYLPLKYRLKYCWRLLRGQPTTYGSVLLNLDDAESFSQEIAKSAKIRRENRQRNS